LFGFQKPETNVAFQSVFQIKVFKSWTKIMQVFEVRVEWGIGGLKSKWRRMMKIFDSTK
jgi:hypothetical protein